MALGFRPLSRWQLAQRSALPTFRGRLSWVAVRMARPLSADARYAASSNSRSDGMRKATWLFAGGRPAADDCANVRALLPAKKIKPATMPVLTEIRGATLPLCIGRQSQLLCPPIYRITVISASELCEHCGAGVNRRARRQSGCRSSDGIRRWLPCEWRLPRR
jgi:hypothetical protein